MLSSTEFETYKFLSTRTIFILSCLAFLTYQSWLIFSQYSEQNYVTNIQFIKNLISPLPAYTLCYDRYLSLEALFERFPDIDLVKDWKDNYTQLMSRVDRLKYYQVDDETWQQLDQYDKLHQKLQDEMMNQMKPPYIHSELTSYKDFLANITIRGTYLENNQTKSFYSPSLSGHIMNFWNEDNDLMYLLNNPLGIAPVESMFFIGDKHRRCFTFFSRLEHKFRKMQANLKQVYMKIPLHRQWFPYRKKYEIYISIHSPNIIPDFNTFFTLDDLDEYNIIYSKVENQEDLGASTCSNYDLTYQRGDLNMKSDCLFQCLKYKLGSECHLNIMEKLSNTPFRNALFPDERPTKECQMNNDDYYHKEEECSRVCLDECHQEYYFHEIKWTRKEPANIAMTKRSIKLYFVPSSLPKIIVTHLPEMTFMTLFCNFGGLLGMWLGVSMLTTMNDMWELLKNLLAKFKTVNNFNNNNLFIQNNYFRAKIDQTKTTRRRFLSHSNTELPRL